MKILILGNGLSILNFDAQIREWSGEIWGCNRIYLDYGDILTKLHGHVDVMQEAMEYRDKSGLNYSIFEIDDYLTCKNLYRKDSGSTIVAEALTRGHEIEVCGFDFGGLDVYSPGHENKNKTTWIKRWRIILEEFGYDKVKFWGYDHKPFLMSHDAAGEYFRKYSKGKSHMGDEYSKLQHTWKNDYSRIYKLIPCVLLKNIGDREWTITEHQGIFGSGESIRLPGSTASKYLDLYPKDFEILPLPNEDHCNILVRTMEVQENE